MEVRNRFKGLDLIDRVPDELWTEVSDIVQETGIKTIPMENPHVSKGWPIISDQISCSVVSDFLWPHECYMCTCEECVFCGIPFGWNLATQRVVHRLRPVVSTPAEGFFDFQNLWAYENLMNPNLHQNYNLAWFLCTMKLRKCWSGSGFLIISS